MLIEIPRFFKEKLSESVQYQNGVNNALQCIEEFIQPGRLQFFPDFTDHGPVHLSEVLQTAEWLITDEAKEVLTAQDISAFSLAVFFHDLALHITKEEFLTILSTDWPDPIKGYHEIRWNLLWDEFLEEASRYDDRKLVSIFGSSLPVELLIDFDDLSERNCRLIGEFIRKYHTRLAHEFLVFGLPTRNSVERNKLNAIPEWLRNIAGLIARSHGMSLRKSLSFFQNEYFTTIEYKSVHFGYLASLLRIADYLQIHNERAPEHSLRYRWLRSPISIKEWEKHNAVSHIQWEINDPEAIMVISNPQSSGIFLELQSLFQDIQNEIDGAWAVIGEIFGRLDRLKKLTLKLRRVRSNFEDFEKFEKTVDYYPVRAAFEAGNADVLKLLIHPLYGNKPGIGVRELLQNSIDAVRERWVLQGKTNLGEKNPDVRVRLFKNKSGDEYIEIHDVGIGMNLDVVLNYFLKAGASFRNSDNWQKNFVAEGKSKVLRTGRFGIGALAAFLLGEEITVETRHIHAKEGIKFTAKLTDNSIDLIRHSMEIGTNILIRLYKRTAKDLLESRFEAFEGDTDWKRFDWFCLASPSIQYSNELDEEPMKQYWTIPQPNTTLPLGWDRISIKDYEDVQWTYNACPTIVCNGFVIDDAKFHRSYFFGDYDNRFRYRMPKLSVFDRQSLLPINLVRDGLSTYRLPFENLILREISKKFILSTFNNALNTHPVLSKNRELVEVFHMPWDSIISPKKNYHQPSLLNLAATANGLTLADENILSKLEIKNSVILPIAGNKNEKYKYIKDLAAILSPNSTILFLEKEPHSKVINIFIRMAMQDISWHPIKDQYISGIKMSGSDSLFSELENIAKKDIWPFSQDKEGDHKPPDEKNIAQWKKNLFNDQMVTREWGVTRSEIDETLLINFVASKQSEKFPFIFAEWSFDWSNFNRYKSNDIEKECPLSFYWEKYVDGLIVPYDQNERFKLLTKVKERMANDI